MSQNGEMNELVEEFLVESHENLDALDQDLVELEADASNLEMLSRISSGRFIRLRAPVVF